VPTLLSPQPLTLITNFPSDQVNPDLLSGKSGRRKEDHSSNPYLAHWPNSVASNDPNHPYSASSHLPPSSTKHAAIALDCEMGYSATGETELIRMTAIDFFTGNTLIDNLVQPSVAMKHYNTHYSGITARDMREAVRKGTAINGRDTARQMLFDTISPSTVIIVHGGSSDFTALRWLHPHIVDTFILGIYDGVKQEGGMSLQNLTKIKLGLDIQKRDKKNGVLGHDSLEDALATRELCLNYVGQIPD
jgi:DNA polymerase III epsilon subunit-like protein